MEGEEPQGAAADLRFQTVRHQLGDPQSAGEGGLERHAPGTFLADTPRGVAYGVCRVTLQGGHRAVRIPCGQGCHLWQRHHVGCVVEALVRVAAPAPLRCPEVNCVARYTRWGSLKAMVQPDPGLRIWARRMEGGITGDEDRRSRRLWYGWDQNSQGIEPPLDAVSWGELRQRFATGKYLQRYLAGAYARLRVDVLSIINHALREHRPNRSLATPNSLLRATKLWQTLANPAALTAKPHQEATEIRDGAPRRHSLPAPVTDGVNEYKGHNAAGCRPGSYRRRRNSNVRSRRVVMREV